MRLLQLLNTLLDKRAARLENARFGILAMYNAIQSCVGSIAVMKVLQNEAGMLWLAITTAMTMASNSVFIAQGTVKVCLILFYTSVLLNSLIIIFNY